MVVTYCTDCKFCNSSRSGRVRRDSGVYRIQKSCRLQPGAAYYNDRGDYSKMFDNCPLKEGDIIVTLNPVEEFVCKKCSSKMPIYNRKRKNSNVCWKC